MLWKFVKCVAYFFLLVVLLAIQWLCRHGLQAVMGLKLDVGGHLSFDPQWIKSAFEWVESRYNPCFPPQEADSVLPPAPPTATGRMAAVEL